MRFGIIAILFLLPACQSTTSKEKKEEEKKAPFSVIGYYAGNSTLIDSFPIEKLTHIIYSFCHLKGNRLSVDNAGDSATIKKLVALKSRNPQMKVILSLGGWGGCKFCSPVFASDSGRKEFASSTKEIINYFKADGIDLDWEYPAIPGHPGHEYQAADKPNFTALVRTLRDTLGNQQEISFASGGFDQFIDSSIDWKEVMPLLDKVNIMSYDLVHGYSKLSGHHTPLYSTPSQKQSTDNAVTRMLAAGVPAEKMVIGAAFYCRFFKNTDTANNGLYQSTSFYHGVSYSRLYDSIAPSRGFVQYWDDVAKAAYAYNADRKILATYDDSVSIRHKTKYAMDKKLNGIMFWQLVDDKKVGGLLDVIDRTVKEK